MGLEPTRQCQLILNQPCLPISPRRLILVGYHRYPIGCQRHPVGSFTPDQKLYILVGPSYECTDRVSLILGWGLPLQLRMDYCPDRNATHSSWVRPTDVPDRVPLVLSSKTNSSHRAAKEALRYRDRGFL